MGDTEEASRIESGGKITPERKHWLDYIDVSARVMLPAVAIWWAVSSFHHQNTQNEKHLSIQIKQQNDSMQSQRETAEAQLASSLLPWFKCESVPQRLMAQEILGSVSPKQAFLINRVLAKCPMNSKEREKAEKYSLQNSLSELNQEFLQQLNLARQYRSVGLHRRAAEEYEKAYNELPESLRAKTDQLAASTAREAMHDGEFARASDLFEQVFRLVETP
jgi:tetratricopeptide (TPR) repeat protein